MRNEYTERSYMKDVVQVVVSSYEFVEYGCLGAVEYC